LGTVKRTGRDWEDYEFLRHTARAGREAGISHFSHLDQPVGIWNYVRIANEIAERVPAGRVLDWGCGLGQMTYLLRRRGFDVVAYDIGDTVSEDGAFDAVLSCGVLEHVDEFSGVNGNELASLREIHRVLKPGGFFPIYQLPQRHTWQEAITRTLGIGYTHPRRFTEEEIRDMLAATGFHVAGLKRFNMLPKNLTGLPAGVRDFYSSFSDAVMAADRLLSRVPIVNRIAGVLEVLARRR
jgi:2-polyprenyl-3-methyl-5-hydroxy-6-metoxy-1,4-benzoquinol methylase